MAEELVALLPSLMGLAWALTGSRADSEELVQSAVAAVIPVWPQVNDPKRYVRQIMVNRHRDAMRRSLVVGEELRAVIDPGQTRDHSENVSARIDLDRALARLPTLTRTVLVLRFVDDQTSSQIGKQLGLPAGTVRRIIHEGVRVLRLDSGLRRRSTIAFPEVTL